jgi:anti-sigma factor (TIGR02949 family)
MKKTQTLDCEQALAQVFDFIDHQLNAKEREAMAQHLQTCKSCFSRAEFEQRLKQKLGALRERPSPRARARIEKLIKSL